MWSKIGARLLGALGAGASAAITTYAAHADVKSAVVAGVSAAIPFVIYGVSHSVVAPASGS